MWQAVLRTVCRGEGRSAETVSFWRKILTEAAVQLGVTHASLVSELDRSFAAKRDHRPGAFGAVVETLYREGRPCRLLPTRRR